MRPYQLMLVHLVLGLVFVTGCGVDHGSGGPGGGGVGGVTLVISTTAAPFGVAGNAYSATLATTGGTAPFMWAVFGGVLPDGLTLNTTTGVVTGMPTAAGSSTPTFRVTDSAGKTATEQVVIVIHPRTDRLSVNSDGVPGDGASSAPSIDSTGRLVAFDSQATNLLGPSGPTISGPGQQVYVHDWQANDSNLISKNGTTVLLTGGNGTSSAPSVSGDGSSVAFVSLAPDLLPVGSPAIAGQQIYLHNRTTGQASLISKNGTAVLLTGGNGTSSAPSVSGDGSSVAFVSLAPDLLPVGSPAIAGQQIYLHNRTTGQASLISKNGTAVLLTGGNGTSSAPSVSGDGSSVAFVSLAPDLLPVGSPAIAGQQIYLHNRTTGQASLISKNGTAVLLTGGNGTSSAPSVSGDGRFTAFLSSSSDLLPMGSPAISGQQIYLHDRVTGQTSLISRNGTALVLTGGNGSSSAPSISGDGNLIAFVSLAPDLLPGGSPTVSGQQIYLHNRVTGQTMLVSKNNATPEVHGNGPSDTTSINANATAATGGVVAFKSLSGNLASGGGQHVYVRAVP